MRAVVTPGDGIAARWPDAAAVIGPAGHDADALTAALDAASGRDEATARTLLESAPAAISAAVVLLDGSGALWRVLVRGDATVTHGGATIAAATGAVASGDATGTPVTLAVDATTPAAAGGVGDLRSGIVAGAGLTLGPAVPGPAGSDDGDGPATEAAVATASTQSPTTSAGEFTFVDLRATAAAPTRVPLPVEGPLDPELGVGTTVFDRAELDRAGSDEPRERPEAEVLGIMCGRGHFNHPHARYCNRCGLSMLQLTHNLVSHARPTLGFLVFDDGATWALDRSYLVGRDTTGHTHGDLDRLGVGGDASTVSADHAEIRLENWDVTLVDLGSTNGTFVWDGAQGRWDRLAARRPRTLAPGSTAAVGHRTFVYESALLR